MITTTNISKKSSVTTKEEALELVQIAIKQESGPERLKTINVFFWNDGKIDVDISWTHDNSQTVS